MQQRDWNLYALVSTIEIERHLKSNPALPEWLAESYAAAWQRVLSLAVSDLPGARDQETVRALLGAVALSKGELKMGALLSYSDESEIAEILDDRHAWSALYE